MDKYYYWDKAIQMIKDGGLPEVHEFDMSVLGLTKECGTAACLAGTAYFLEHEKLTTDPVFPKIENLFDLLLVDLYWTRINATDVVVRYEQILWARSQQIKGADLSYLDLSGTDLSGLDLSYCDLRGTSLIDCNIDDCNLRGAIYDEETTFTPFLDLEDKGMIYCEQFNEED